jgi:glycogen synthase
MLRRLDGNNAIDAVISTPQRAPMAQSVSLLNKADSLKFSGLMASRRLRFGGTSLHAGTKGLWITPEFTHVSFPPGFKAGGVGQVGAVIPWQLKARGLDVRPIFPLYKGMDTLGFTKADLEPVTITEPSGEVQTYELFYKMIDGVPCYAIKNENFSDYTSLYKAKEVKPEDKDKKAVEKVPEMIMVSNGSGGYQWVNQAETNQPPLNIDTFRFNQAVAAFMPKLDALDKDKPAKEWQFKGGADVNFYNDWLSGVALSEIKEKSPDYFKRTGSVFYVHNTYDYMGNQQLKTAEKLGVEIPQEIKAEHQTEQQKHWFSFIQSWMGRPEGKVDGDKYAFSPLAWGLRYADSVAMNHFFKETNLKSTYNASILGDPMFLNFLREKDMQKHVHDMHHAISPEYSATNNEHLRSDGFSELHTDVSPSWQAGVANGAKKLANTIGFFLPKSMKFKTLNDDQLQAQAQFAEHNRFKQANKIALQAQLGLNKDPNAIVYTWWQRPDPNQKGSLMMIQTLSKFLHEHPKAQAVLGGGFSENDPNPIIANFVKNMRKDPALKGRLHIFSTFEPQKTSVRVMSATDVMMHPSNYEPYGLVGLEAMIMGAVPLVTPRDGMYATTFDPHVLPHYHPSDAERNRGMYGQTGFFVDLPDDGMNYFNHVRSNPNHMPSDPVVRKHNDAFLKAMDRTYKAAEANELPHIIKNAQAYVANEHSYDKIAELYDPVIGDALKQRQARLNPPTNTPDPNTLAVAA